MSMKDEDQTIPVGVSEAPASDGAHAVDTADTVAEHDDTGETTVMDTPPSIPLVDTDDDENSNHGSNRKRNIIIAASIAAIILLAGAGGGYAVACNNVNAGMQAAHAQATNVDKQLSDKLKEAQTLLDGTTKEKVADEATLTKLADAVKTAGSQQGTPDNGSNPAMVWTLLNMQDAYDSDTEDAQAVIESLDKTMDEVADSINDKQLTDAKAKLDQLVADAQKLYDSTDGKVQDNATRDALKTALDNAKKGDVTSVDALDKLTAALNDAQTKVNDSVKAKEQADAEAQAQAEAAAAAANATTSTGSGYTGGGYSAGSSGSANSGSENAGSAGSSNSADRDGDGFNDVVPWLGQDSMGGNWHYSNSDCAIYYPDGNVKDVPCS